MGNIIGNTIKKFIGYKEISTANPEYSNIKSEINRAENDLSICIEIREFLSETLGMIENCKSHLSTAENAISKGIYLGEENKVFPQRIDSLIESFDSIKTEIEGNIDFFDNQISELKSYISEQQALLASTPQYITQRVKENI